MDFITYMQAQLLAAVETAAKNYDGEVSAESLSAMEVAVKGLSQAVGQASLTEWLNKQDPKYAADSVPCECGKVAHYVRRREGVTLTLLGRVHYQRAYYVCECGQGVCPVDKRLAIQPGQMSEELVKIAALVGIEDAYGSSSETLRHTTQVELSPNSIRQACHQIGESVEAREQQDLTHSQDLTAQLTQRRENQPPARDESWRVLDDR
jgi:hypothetical protein